VYILQQTNALQDHKQFRHLLRLNKNVKGETALYNIKLLSYKHILNGTASKNAGSFSIHQGTRILHTTTVGQD